MASVPLGIETSVSGVSAVVGDLKKIEAQAASVAKSSLTPGDAFKKSSNDIKRGIGDVRQAFSALGSQVSGAGGQVVGVVQQMAGAFSSGGAMIGSIAAAGVGVAALATAWERNISEKQANLKALADEEKKISARILAARGIETDPTKRAFNEASQLAEAGNTQAVRAEIERLRKQVEFNDAVVRGIFEDSSADPSNATKQARKIQEQSAGLIERSGAFEEVLRQNFQSQTPPAKEATDAIRETGGDTVAAIQGLEEWLRKAYEGKGGTTIEFL